jgi:hypothetical protein
MVMSPVGLETKNRCVGEGQQQLSIQSVSQSVSQSKDSRQSWIALLKLLPSND